MPVSLFLKEKLIGLLKTDYAPTSFTAALWGPSAELTYTGYARAPIARTDFAAASIVGNKARVAISAPLAFGTPTGSITNNVVEVRIFDNSNNLLATVPIAKTVTLNQPISLSSLYFEADQTSTTGPSDAELVRWLDRIFRGQSYSVRATLFVDLYTAADALTDYGGYTQQAFTVATGLADPVNDGNNLARILTTTAINFPTATSNGSAAITNGKVWGEAGRTNLVLTFTVASTVMETADTLSIPVGNVFTSMGEP